MNIDELTLGQVKELNNLVAGGTVKTSILSGAIGKYVIVRSSNEGINAGTLLKADETGCVLKDVRRIWYHKPKDSSVAWYEGVAKTGLHNDSKISCTIDEKYIIEAYSITICSEEGATSIKGKDPHGS